MPVLMAQLQQGEDIAKSLPLTVPDAETPKALAIDKVGVDNLRAPSLASAETEGANHIIWEVLAEGEDFTTEQVELTRAAFHAGSAAAATPGNQSMQWQDNTDFMEGTVLAANRMRFSVQGVPSGATFDTNGLFVIRIRYRVVEVPFEVQMWLHEVLENAAATPERELVELPSQEELDLTPEDDPGDRFDRFR